MLSVKGRNGLGFQDAEAFPGEDLNILVDIIHPAHVHFFRHAIGQFEKRGHKVAVTAREKDITIELLNNYGIPFTTLSRKGRSKFALMSEMIIRDVRLWRFCREFKPDILTGISGIFAAHLGFLMRKPSIVWDDTEHQRLSHMITFPFADVICNPSSYLNDLGSKQLRYEGCHELAYLHPDCFEPDSSVLDCMGVKEGEKFVIMRFVSWGASHDIGHRGLSVEMKKRCVVEFSKYAKVFITSEAELPEDLRPYQIRIAPEKIHDALYYATIYFGESGTMASEAAVLGTPAVNVATSAVLIGIFAELEKYGLMDVVPDERKALAKGLELLRDEDLAVKMRAKREKFLSEKINVTKFMVWFIENYPDSRRILRERPDYQKEFK